MPASWTSAGATGLYSRVESDGRRWYCVRFTDQDGIRRKERAGRVRRDALELLDRRRTEVRQGLYRPARLLRRQATAATFAELGERFLTEYASERRSTYYPDVLRGRRPERPQALWRFFAHRRLSELEADPTIFDAYRRMRSKSVGPSTVRKELVLLATMFRQGRRWGVMHTNPMADVARPREPRADPSRARRLTWQEYLDVEAAAVDWLRPVIRFGMATALRLKEVAMIRWRDVELHERWVALTSDSKSGTADVIPLGRVAFQVIADTARAARRVFLGPRGSSLASPAGRNLVSQATRRAMREAGLPDRSFKSLRTTAGTVVGKRFGATLEGALLRHAEADRSLASRHYLELRLNDLRPLVEVLDIWIERGVEA